MKNIVWLASYPKSGNTWVRAIVCSALFGSLDIRKLGKMIPNFSVIAAQLKQEKFDTPGQIRHLWGQAQKHLCESSGSNRILLKTHNAAGVYDIGEFPSRQFTQKAVYVVRDPRDVAISYSHHFGHDLQTSINSLLNESNFNFNPKDLSRGEFLSSWGNHVKSWRNTPFPVLLIR